MQLIPSGDEELLRQRLEETGYRGARISGQTAEGIARWFARRAIGRGFSAFLASGLVTPQFYRELTYLYDLRRPDIERRLNALVRYSLSQPSVHLTEKREEGKHEDRG